MKNVKKKIRIALICFDNPFLKPVEGGKRAMFSRLRSLALMADDYEVDVYLHNKRSEGMAGDFGELGKCMNIRQYPMNRNTRCLIGCMPICVSKRYVADCVNDLQSKQYDVAIYEGEQVAKYRLKNVVRAKYHIIYMHDIESAYRMEIACSHPKPLLRLGNWLEALRFKRIEQCIHGKFDRIWFISKEECKYFGAATGALGKCTYMPFPAMEIGDYIAQGNAANRMLYVGDMSVQHNYLSVEWFAREVLPKIRQTCPGAEFMTVGRISDENAEKLRALGANVCGYVDDLDAAYEEAACIAVPVLYGAGVKVKIIDALARGQIVVTTSKGIEGTELQPGRHLIVEDDAVWLAEICAGILSDRAAYRHLSEDGLAFIRSEHTVAHQAEIMDREIRLLMHR